MQKPWIQSYEAGVDAEIDINRCQSIVGMFEDSVRKYDSQPALSNMGKELSYTECAQLAADFASFLQHTLKLSRGERIALMMPNVLQYPIAIFGALKAGLVVVNINPLYTPRELEHQLNDSGATTIVILENFANTLESVLPRTQIKHIILANIGEMFGFFKAMVMNLVIRKLKKLVPRYHIPNTVSFKQALKLGAQQAAVPVKISHDDLAFLQYTGGTTGVAKGVMLTHGNICANMIQAAEWIKNKLEPGKEVVIAALPLYHIFSLSISLMVFIQAGAKIVLITNPRDINGFIKELNKQHLSVFIGVNTLFNALLNNPAFANVDFSNLKLSLAGGMGTYKTVAEQWFSITGQTIIDAYGLTESSPGVCCNPLNLHSYSDGIGLPISNTEVELRNNKGEIVAIGEPGELWVKGPQVMKGYWLRPDDTAKVMDERGFFGTGDIAVMNEKGWFKIIERKNDLIMISGFTIYPNEIENVVTQHPQVLEAACIGVEHERAGEKLKLFVVRKDENLTATELIAYCRTQLTAYKVPKDIEFRDELPKSNIGKILRRELRKEEEQKVLTDKKSKMVIK